MKDIDYGSGFMFHSPSLQKKVPNWRTTLFDEFVFYPTEQILKKYEIVLAMGVQVLKL